MSLLDVLRGVMLDPAEQAAYNADPAAYLGRYGYEDVDPADLAEAFGLVADTLPPEQAQAAWQAAATPDGDAFGAVTPDFDSDGGFTGADAAGEADVALAEDPLADTTLSFGQGEAPDSPPAPDAVAPDPGAGSPGDGEPGDGDVAAEPGAGGEAAGAGLDLDDLDHDDAGLDDLGQEGGYEGGLDDEAGGYDGGGLDDDLGDLDRIDGLDELSMPGPDDTDIGSF